MLMYFGMGWSLGVVSIRTRVLLLTVGAVLASQCGAALATPGNAKKGLGPGISVPAWALHARVHFLPVSHSAPALSGSMGEKFPIGIQENFAPAGGTEHPLLYQGGSVQHNPHVYVIFWGAKWNEGAGPTSRTSLLKMYEGLKGSFYEWIILQYFDATEHITSNVSVSSYTDTGVTAPTSVNYAKLEEEALNAINANGWTIESDTQFVVIPAPGSTYESSFDKGFCGYHEYIGAHKLNLTFLPYVTDEPFAGGCLHVDKVPSADAAISDVASHEFAESATDPLPVTGWATEGGWEIGDICEGHSAEVTEGTLKGSWVQPLWDNREKTCSISDTAPYTPEVQAISKGEVGFGPKEIKLAGWVNPEGYETHYHFEYGPTTSYGTTIPTTDVNAGSGYANVSASQTITGIAEGIYHFRLVATNSTGTSYGEDRIVVSPGFIASSVPLERAIALDTGAIACVQMQVCMVVGEDWSTSATRWEPRSALWNGASWSVKSTPSLSAGTEGYLGGVSCSSATACTAVGYQAHAGAEPRSLAERWNGSEWTVQPTPTGGLKSDRMRAVSCSGSTECMAVGDQNESTTTEGTLAERWNGTEWIALSTPNPTGAQGSRLTGVSCPSASSCIAVGYYYTPTYNTIGYEVPFVERWNGSEWSIQSTPATLKGSELTGVSCTSTTACTAVGYQGYGHEGGIEQREKSALVERWNGAQWSLQSTPSVEGSAFNGVSCVSSTYCMAVGRYSTNSIAESYNPESNESEEVLGESWNGTAWTVSAVPGVRPWPYPLNQLEAVSCIDQTHCVAINEYGAAAKGHAYADFSYASPGIYAETASSVKGAEATLSATVSTDAMETHYQWEYGTTTAYGSVAPASPGVVGSSALVSTLIKGLEQGVTYHYRIAATNAIGTTYGADQTFTTVWYLPGADSANTSVACASSSFCMSVGRATNADTGGWGEFGLAREWNGSEWLAGKEPTAPSGARYGGLYGVACPSIELCVAVGRYVNSSGKEVTLAEKWRPVWGWTVLTTPNPSEATASKLLSVSCASSTSCTAVGYYAKGTQEWLTLAERWNGTEWSIQSTPNPTSTTPEVELQGVSCASTSECEAVGRYRFFEGAVEHWGTLAERWNGTEWSIQSTPNPTEGNVNALLGVSCVAGGACKAVGWWETAAGVRRTLGEAYGTGWTIEKTREPTGKMFVLAGVSCASASACMAVGHYQTNSGAETTLAQEWNGSFWVSLIPASPNDASSSSLAGVSCTAANACTGVGSYVGSGKLESDLAESWNGMQWATVAAPGAANSSTGVSCTSSTFCMSVGRATNTLGLTEIGLAREWTASAEWVVHPDPVMPSQARSTALSGVFCSSSEACTAVGHQTNGSGSEAALAEGWTKAAGWSAQTTPSPAEATSRLSAVSCSSSTACTAVGSYAKTEGRLILAERWNGTAWSIQSTPTPAGGSEVELAGVSCASTTECVAVGHYRFFEGEFEHWATLTERWNGTEWSIQTTPNPTEGRFSNLLGVSCVSSTVCKAVGYTQTSAGVRTTLAESWNGTSWSIQTTPNPSGGKVDTLTGVSCTSTTMCRAVGHYVNSSSVEMPMAEGWNGTEWSIVTVPNFTEVTKGSALAGVSCIAGGECLAVGEYQAPGKIETSLGGRF